MIYSVEGVTRVPLSSKNYTTMDNLLHEFTQNATKEEWKPIAGSKGYEISSLGRARHGDRILKELDLRTAAWSHYKGYGIRMIGWTTTHFQYAHRLVAEAFYGTIPATWHVNHINGVKADNRVENLEVISASDNRHHAAWMALEHKEYAAAIAMVAPDQYEARLRTKKDGTILLGQHETIEAARDVINQWMLDHRVNPQLWYYYSRKDRPTKTRAKEIMIEEWMSQ